MRNEYQDYGIVRGVEDDYTAKRIVKANSIKIPAYGVANPKTKPSQPTTGPCPSSNPSFIFKPDLNNRIAEVPRGGPRYKAGKAPKIAREPRKRN